MTDKIPVILRYRCRSVLCNHFWTVVEMKEDFIEEFGKVGLKNCLSKENEPPTCPKCNYPGDSINLWELD